MKCNKELLEWYHKAAEMRLEKIKCEIIDYNYCCCGSCPACDLWEEAEIALDIIEDTEEIWHSHWGYDKREHEAYMKAHEAHEASPPHDRMAAGVMRP